MYLNYKLNAQQSNIYTDTKAYINFICCYAALKKTEIQNKIFDYRYFKDIVSIRLWKWIWCPIPISNLNLDIKAKMFLIVNIKMKFYLLFLLTMGWLFSFKRWKQNKGRRVNMVMSGFRSVLVMIYFKST